MNRRTLAMMLLPLGLMAAAVAYAHNALCSCFENDNGTITCEGGFSDGGKAVGVPLRVFDSAGKVLVEGIMSKDSTFHVSETEGGLPCRVQCRGGPHRHDRWPRH